MTLMNTNDVSNTWILDLVKNQGPSGTHPMNISEISLEVVAKSTIITSFKGKSYTTHDEFLM